MVIFRGVMELSRYKILLLFQRPYLAMIKLFEKIQKKTLIKSKGFLLCLHQIYPSKHDCFTFLLRMSKPVFDRILQRQPETIMNILMETWCFQTWNLLFLFQISCHFGMGVTFACWGRDLCPWPWLCWHFQPLEYHNSQYIGDKKKQKIPTKKNRIMFTFRSSWILLQCILTFWVKKSLPTI